MHVVAHHSLDELQALVSRRSHSALHLKLRAIILARSGWTAPRIAEALGKGRRSVQRWIAAYNEHGLPGLNDCRGGNHRRLTPQQEAQLKAHLDALAEDPNAGVRHAAELHPWIEQHFGVRYSLSGLYALLHRLDYSWLMPRPRHPKADPAAQEAFKKSADHVAADRRAASGPAHRSVVPG